MDRHSDVVQNENGRAVSGASVLILDSAGAVATIYADRAGTGLTNPIPTDELGRWSFCAADGVYEGRVYLGGKLKATVLDIRLEDPSDGFAVLADDAGAALVGTAGGVTVQAALDDLTEQVGGLENYTLPPATDTTLGGIKVGGGLSVAGDGTLSAPAYTLPVASDTTLGGVKVGSGLAIDALGVLSNPGVEAGAVTSVNTVTPDGGGNVTLTTDNIAESGTPTNQWFTAARVRSVVLTGLSTATNAAIAATETVLVAMGKLQAQITGLGTSKQDASAKDATGGYAGLTLFKINFKNAANTFTSFFTNTNTAARTYTFPDKDGTVAMLADVSPGNGVLLASVDISSAVAQVDFLTSIPAGYDRIAIDLFGLTVSATGALILTFANAGVIDAANNYGSFSVEGAAPSASNNLRPSGTMNSGAIANVTIEILNSSAASRRAISLKGHDGGTALLRVGTYSGGVISGFRIAPGAGNFTAGSIRVRGFRNS